MGHNLRTRSVGHRNRTNSAISIRQQRHRVRSTFRSSLARNRRAANSDCHDRCLNRHCVITGLRYLARDKRKNTLHNIECALARICCRVVNQIVNNHATRFTQRKRRIVRKHDTDARTAFGLYNIPNEYLRALLRLNVRAVDTGQKNTTLNLFNIANSQTLGLANPTGNTACVRLCLSKLYVAEMTQRRRTCQV